MKNYKLFISTILWMYFPLFLISQDYQYKEVVNKINQILTKSPYISSAFDVETTTLYSLKLKYDELIIREETSSAYDTQRKEYILLLSDIKSFGIFVNSNSDIINIKYQNFDTNNKYFKYLLYSLNSNSEGLEFEINIYIGNIPNIKYNELDILIRELFNSISENQYYTNSQYSEGGEYYKYNTDIEVYKNDNSANNNYSDKYDNGYSESSDIEYYDIDGFRIYSESEAYYYRTTDYDDDGILIVIDFINENTPYMAAQISYRDPNNRNNDIYNGRCIWFYEDGDIHLIAFYKNGELEDNEYVEFDEQGTATLIFIDYFTDNRNNWELGNSTDIYTAIESGFLYVESKNNYKINRLIKYEIDLDVDFILESKFKLIHGNNNSGQGIIWGFKDWDNYFSFRISNDGYYEIIAFNDGIKFDLSDNWIKSDYINKGSVWNKLQLNKYGDEILFSINGHIVEKHDFYSYKGNYIGFIVGPNRKIKVDNLTVKQNLGRLNEGESSDSGKRKENSNESDIKGTGSGVVLTKDGYIVTNYHVAGDANNLAVAFYENNERITYNAKYIVGDIEHDLAIIKIDDKNFNIFDNIPYNLKIDDSDLGEKVFTLGYPFASYMGAEIIFNEGTISSQTGLGGDDAHYQISVPIQPGNSGGPLFDLKGNLVGIVDSRTEEINNRPAENIAYAIKTYYVKRLIDKLPNRINIPNSYSTNYIETTDKIKILKEFVPIILIK